MSPDPQALALEVAAALKEDIGSGDVTAALLPPGLQGVAEIRSREPMLLCGQPWVNEVFLQVDNRIQIDWRFSEGAWLPKPELLCIIKGSVPQILTAERTALNFLQTLSATATQTHHYVQKLKGTPTRILDTRKTLPGLRSAQKYAVRCAGGMNHRLGLFDAYLIKENHIKACGSVRSAILLARRAQKLLVEVEVENLKELKEALEARPDRILLDNFNLALLQEAVHMNQPKICPLEASGGINLDNIAEIAALGLDFISVGALTKSIQAIDLSLLLKEV